MRDDSVGTKESLQALLPYVLWFVASFPLKEDSGKGTLELNGRKRKVMNDPENV